MANRRKTLLFITFAVLLICSSIAGWTAIKIVAWARELPSRFVIEDDGRAFANALGAAVTESYHQALRSDDPSLQLQVLSEQFAPAIAEDRDYNAWIRDEYLSDIRELLDSQDPAVSLAASELLALLESEDDSLQP